MPQAVVNEDASTLALNALAWTLGDPERARRLLDVTGVAPADLRAGLNDPAVLGAALQFLLANERDLLACAADLGVPALSLADAAARLEQQ